MLKRSSRADTEDRWHRPARRNEKIGWPADRPDGPVWCTDPKHGTPGTLVCTIRHGRGKRWLARWVDHDGNERSKSFDRKPQAQSHITAVTTAMTTGSYADPRRGSVTFGVVAEQWFAGKSTSVKPKTAADYRSVLDTVVLPKWEDAKLRDIEHGDIQGWVSWLVSNPAARQRPAKRDDGEPDQNRGLSPSRVVHAYQVVDQILRYAVRSKLIAVNPADDIELPRKVTAEKAALTHVQVRELANAAGDLGTMIYVMAYAGLRYGECAALRVGDVDTARGRVRVSRSVTYVTGSGHIEGTTKTHASRMVPVPRFVADRLAAEIKGRDAGERLFPCAGYDSMPLDFFRWRFDKACATAGLTGVTPHTLRHTAGSLALASGASVVTVQRLLGHQSAITTMTTYAHMLPDDFDTLAAAMDRAAQGA